jgi:hypothetical protein
MVLQSKVFLITLLHKFSPYISPKRTFLRRITTKLNQSLHTIKHKTHQHRRTASGDCSIVVVDPLSTIGTTRRSKSLDDIDDAAIRTDEDPHIDVRLYTSSKECISRNQGLQGMLDMQRPTSGSTAESTRPSAVGDGDAVDQRRLQPQNQSSSFSGDDLEEGGGGDGGQRQPHRNLHHHHDENHHHHHHKSSRIITPADAAEFFNKIPFPEPRRVILLRPRSLD